MKAPWISLSVGMLAGALLLGAPALAADATIAPRGYAAVGAIDTETGTITLRGETLRVNGETLIVDEDGAPMLLSSLRVVHRSFAKPPDPSSYDNVYYEKDRFDSGLLRELRRVKELPR
jgi:hypothetical protein